MDPIRNKWESLLQSRPDMKGMVGKARLVGGHIGYNDEGNKSFHFITNKGSFSFNATTQEFRSTFQIR